MQVIARIGKLTALNGSTISASERKDCELQYLRAVAGMCSHPCSATCEESRDMVSVPGGILQVSSIPRAVQLVQKHPTCSSRDWQSSSRGLRLKCC